MSARVNSETQLVTYKPFDITKQCWNDFWKKEPCTLTALKVVLFALPLIGLLILTFLYDLVGTLSNAISPSLKRYVKLPDSDTLPRTIKLPDSDTQPCTIRLPEDSDTDCDNVQTSEENGTDCDELDTEDQIDYQSETDIDTYFWTAKFRKDKEAANRLAPPNYKNLRILNQAKLVLSQNKTKQIEESESLKRTAELLDLRFSDDIRD